MPSELPLSTDAKETGGEVEAAKGGGRSGKRGMAEAALWAPLTVIRGQTDGTLCSH